MHLRIRAVVYVECVYECFSSIPPGKTLCDSLTKAESVSSTQLASATRPVCLISLKLDKPSVVYILYVVNVVYVSSRQ